MVGGSSGGRRCGGRCLAGRRRQQPRRAEPAARCNTRLNMSTIRGQKLSVPDQVELAAKAGYDAIEPWMGELRQYHARAAAA